MSLPEESIIELFRDIFAQIGAETVNLLPKVFVALIVIMIMLLVIKVLNLSFRKLLKLARLDELFKRFTGFTLPFSMDKLIIFLADLGIVLIVVYGLAHLFLGAQYLQLINDGLYYGARVFSIIIIAIIIFAAFNVLIGRVRVETRLRSYAMLIALFLITAMLIDVTALSESVKNALTLGLSIGVGIAIGAFAVWFFFHDYLDRRLRTEARHQAGEKCQENQRTE
ncbi:hypothetical protein H5T51_08505 [Candidatus Bathyarchaeota archaeon]|nr:hypothetical protein [Candidatus Bathyarchaeota archaeon]